jgi:uncharacterized protein
MANRLAACGSPYLLQHAHNPVDWYPWGEEAFHRAVEENKPLLISIGYATCHWCHVMERESFEDESIADYMNAHFVCIKVDREEHPEVDQLYMDACQLVSGNGGWPLNCFALPDRRPFFAGTYYPPQPFYKRPSWRQVLEHMQDMWAHKQEVVYDQADRLSQLIAKGDTRLLGSALKIQGESPGEVLQPLLQEALDVLEKSLDKELGGTKGAPKFPMFNTLNLLLEAGYFLKDEKWSAYAHHWGLQMLRGGIYDQIGGGLCRYATDDAWMVPHFEKMLYDNAGFLRFYSRLYKVYPEREIRFAIEQTLVFLMREMKSENGLFYSALDADSEGVEGKFYIWDADEMAAVLGDAGKAVIRYLGATSGGNWEGSNILCRTEAPGEFAQTEGMDEESWLEWIAPQMNKLLWVRNKRIRPLRDEKQIAAWNLSLVQGLVDWFEASGESTWLVEATELLDAVLDNFYQSDGSLKRVKIGQDVLHDGNLDDYALAVEGLLSVYSHTGRKDYLEKALSLLNSLESQFVHKSSPLYYFSSNRNSEVFTRKEDLFDNTLPSGNAVMLHNFQRLYALTQDPVYLEKAWSMAETVSNGVKSYPVAFSYWASGLMRMGYGLSTLTAWDKESEILWTQLRKVYLPDCMYKPPLAGSAGAAAGLHICTGDACLPPVFTTGEFYKMKGKEV